ncbi:MAG TPA: sulfatase [Myxococcales bacterium]|nr:sulfatase [Myxococcales bacterium]HIN85837.1 sulfatase [Myxococcales bacterium]
MNRANSIRLAYIGCMLRVCRLVGVLLWLLCSCNDSSPTTAASEDLPVEVQSEETQLSNDVEKDVEDQSDPDTETRPASRPNILLIIADDIGVEASRCYQVGQNLAPTPNIESLCDRGLVFENMWSAPICSPTRAALLTGRYSYRTDVGNTIQPGHPGLSLEEWSIPKVLDANPALGYSHACIGKWHLGPAMDKDHPNKLGFDYFSGLLIGGVQSYTDWKETTNGVTQTNNQYATSRHVDLAIDWVDAQTGPWFLWLALVSPHNPVHLPPAQLHSFSELSGTDEDIEANGGAYFRAMIQAMDTEIGRLFTAIGDEQMANTVVIYLGDNGTSAKVIEAPYEAKKSKGSLYQGGVHVPFVMAGPGVSPGSGRSSALTHVVDLFATILDIAGVDWSTVPADVELDSLSLIPVLNGTKDTAHSWVLTEMFGGAGANKTGKAVRDESYKLTRLLSGTERFYDLKADPYETAPLKKMALDSDAQSHFDTLSAVLDSLPAIE